MFLHYLKSCVESDLFIYLYQNDEAMYDQQLLTQVGTLESGAYKSALSQTWSVLDI